MRQSGRHPSTVLRTVLWGEALDVKASKAHRGLQGAVELIQAQVGKTIGSRNTFAKLFEARSPVELDTTEIWRAWLLLTAIGEDPQDWGLGDDDVPPAFDAFDVGHRLKLARRAQVEAWNRRVAAPRRHLRAAADLDVATLAQSSGEDEGARSSTDRASDYGSEAGRLTRAKTVRPAA